MDPEYYYRHIFECYYIYDYLMKSNMHQTAEVFRNEANLQFNPNDLQTIGWWLYNNDLEFFSQCLQLNEALETQAFLAWLDSQEEMNELPENNTPAFNFNIQINPPESFEKEIGEVPLLYFPPSYIETFGGHSQLLLPSPTSNVNATPQDENVHEEMDPVIKHLINSFWSDEEHFDMREIMSTSEHASNISNSPMSIDNDDGGI